MSIVYELKSLVLLDVVKNKVESFTFFSEVLDSGR